MMGSSNGHTAGCQPLCLTPAAPASSISTSDPHFSVFLPLRHLKAALIAIVFLHDGRPLLTTFKYFLHSLETVRLHRRAYDSTPDGCINAKEAR